MKKKTSAMLAVMLAMTLVAGPVQPSTAASVHLSATKVTLKVGQTKTLKLKKATGKVTWTSSKKDVATVSSKGVIKGISAGNATITAKNNKKKYSCKVTVKSAVNFKAVETDIYNGGLQKITKNLYFKDNGDIPYISLAEWMDIMMSLVVGVDSTFTITCEGKGNTCTLTRNNGFTAEFDFSKNTLYFMDLDAFFLRTNNSLASMESIMPDMAALFEKTSSSFDRYGADYTIDFTKYGIKTYADGGNYYIPLQTFSDIFLSRLVACFALYNGNYIFLSSIPMMEPVLEEYLKGTKRQMSKEFTDFNYNELCLALDYMYGLKEPHGIKTFDGFLTETGLAPYMKQNENNATKVDLALKSMINYYIDDGHTRFSGYSYNSDYNGNADLLKEFENIPYGPSVSHLFDTQEKLMGYYKKYYPDGVKCYEEIGDTAFITFEEFITTEEDYKSAPTEEDASKDTIRLMQYACDRILRPNSPIKKVVLDLSLNGGGLNSTAVYVLGTFLGTGTLVQKDVSTGALSNSSYKVDTNRDGVFDDKDTLAGKGLKLYCFTSDFSFSCGNMVPCRFKDSKEVTLIGQATGGGSCSVVNMSTASGSFFRVSSPWQYSFSKNGSFYDVDRGAEPDVYIKDLSKLYDRAYMSKFLDTIN